MRRPPEVVTTARILVAGPSQPLSSVLYVLLTSEGHDVTVLARTHVADILLDLPALPDLILMHTGRSHELDVTPLRWPPVVGAVAGPVVVLLSRPRWSDGQPWYAVAGLLSLPVRDTDVIASVQAALTGPP